MKKAGAIVGLVVMPALLCVGPAHSADTNPAFAALVMELSGATTPPLVVHREVAAGTKIAIKPGARLALLHYATCDIVSFSGGTVNVTTQGLQAAEANVQGKMPGPCPRLHQIATQRQSVLRRLRPRSLGCQLTFQGFWSIAASTMPSASWIA
jgi:hypothetical protein